MSPDASPTLNSGGWVYGAAVLLAVVGVVIIGLVVFGYLRFAPRFQVEGEGSARAPELRPGRPAPRRAVNVTGAPVVMPAPVPVAAAAAPASAPAAASVAVAAAPVAAAPAPVAPAPAAAAPAAAAPVAPAPAAPKEHVEVAMDQETFDAKLAELLAKGTDRRVAEGQARRAAMIAARAKAGG